MDGFGMVLEWHGDGIGWHGVAWDGMEDQKSELPLCGGWPPVEQFTWWKFVNVRVIYPLRSITNFVTFCFGGSEIITILCGLGFHFPTVICSSFNCWPHLKGIYSPGARSLGVPLYFFIFSLFFIRVQGKMRLCENLKSVGCQGKLKQRTRTGSRGGNAEGVKNEWRRLGRSGGLVGLGNLGTRSGTPFMAPHK